MRDHVVYPFTAQAPSSLASTRTGDQDFDALTRQLWDEHLAGIDPATAVTKTWRSCNWKKWYHELVLDVDDADVTDRVDERDRGEEETESSICESLWSNAKLASPC